MKKTLVSLVLGMTLATSGCAFTSVSDAYYGTIDNNQVQIVNIIRRSMISTTMKVGTNAKSAESEVELILFDYSTGELGDEEQDYIMIGKKDGPCKLYTPRFMNENDFPPITFDSSSKSGLASETKKLFERYNPLFRDYLVKAARQMTGQSQK